mmetsp:Transcript_5239/g.21449  ORF Transcript_5239/g.21449 Transcript_5239/m.21449 type:complete len:246 (-) Transcript_5239:331-1068(-)
MLARHVDDQVVSEFLISLGRHGGPDSDNLGSDGAARLAVVLLALPGALVGVPSPAEIYEIVAALVGRVLSAGDVEAGTGFALAALAHAGWLADSTNHGRVARLEARKLAMRANRDVLVAAHLLGGAGSLALFDGIEARLDHFGEFRRSGSLRGGGGFSLGLKVLSHRFGPRVGDGTVRGTGAASGQTVVGNTGGHPGLVHVLGVPEEVAPVPVAVGELPAREVLVESGGVVEEELPVGCRCGVPL